MGDLTMRGLIAVAVFTLVLVTPSSSPAQVGTTDFNTDLSGNPIVAGQRLRFEYGAVGITFSKSGATTGPCDDVYANSYHAGDFGSPPTLISVCPDGWASDFSENTFGLVRAQFAVPVRGACIEVRPGRSEDFAVMRAYDGGGRLVDESFSIPGETETLCVVGLRIRRVEFSGAGSQYAQFDDFSVDFGPVGAAAVRTLPGAANLPGYGGTRWLTDLEVTNRGDEEMACRVELFVRDESNPDPVIYSMTVAPRASVKIQNALEALFDFEGAATLRVVGIGGALVASARTYNDDPDGTYGQYIAGLAEYRGISPGRRGVMNLLSQSPNGSSGYRTNLGLVNPTHLNLSVTVELYDADGILVDVDIHHLAAYQSIQIDRVIERMAGSTVRDGYLVVSSSTPDALVHAYASVIDNRSGDGIYVPVVLE